MKEKTYVDNRYASKKFSKTLKMIINDMEKNSRNWIAPTKTVFKRRLNGQEVIIMNSSYDEEAPIQIFINQKELKEKITNAQYRVLLAEFGYMRKKYEKYNYSKNDEQLEKKYHFI